MFWIVKFKMIYNLQIKKKNTKFVPESEEIIILCVTCMKLIHIHGVNFNFHGSSKPKFHNVFKFLSI